MNCIWLPIRENLPTCYTQVKASNTCALVWTVRACTLGKPTYHLRSTSYSSFTFQYNVPPITEHTCLFHTPPRWKRFLCSELSHKYSYTSPQRVNRFYFLLWFWMPVSNLGKGCLPALSLTPSHSTQRVTTTQKMFTKWTKVFLRLLPLEWGS